MSNYLILSKKGIVYAHLELKKGANDNGIYTNENDPNAV